MQRIGFDMDGVLLNTFDDFYVAMLQGCKQLNVVLPSPEEVKQIYGRVQGKFNQTIGISKDKEKEYSSIKYGIWETIPIKLVPGVEQALERLAQKIAPPFYLVTAEPTGKNLEFIKSNPVKKYFVNQQEICYAQVDWPKPKTQVLEELGITLFVTDTTVDASACFEAKTKPYVIAIVNAYSYCAREPFEELQKTNPDQMIIVESISQAVDVIVERAS